MNTTHTGGYDPDPGDSVGVIFVVISAVLIAYIIGAMLAN